MSSSEQDHWYQLFETRVSRRTALRGGLLGGAGLAAAALIGCGDDDDDDDGGATATPTATATATETPSGGTATATPTATEEAMEGPVSGGTFRLAATGSPDTLDAVRTQAHTAKAPAAPVYGTLFKQILTTFENVPASDYDPFIAKTWEFTPDGLTLNITLQDAARFVPPGPNAVQPSTMIDRALDSEDVSFSISRFLGTGGEEPAPNAAQLDFIDTVTTPDPQTVRLDFNRVFARAIWRLADTYNLLIYPKETGTAFDPTETMVGSGPFRWDGWKPDVSHRLVRNDSWWGGPDEPYVDAVEWSILDNATQLVQFKAGNLDQLSSIGADQIESLINDSNATVYPRKTLGWGYISRGEPRGVDAPHDDPRVRKAISLSLDRDAMNEAVYNISGLTELGFPMADLVGWHGVQPAGYSGQSVDPRTDPVQGEFIKYDLDEAKKLLDAAGRGDGFSVPYHYTTIYGSAWALEAELYPQLVNEIGIEFATEVDDYSSVYAPKTFRGDFEGVAFQLQAFPDLGDYLTEMYTPGAGRNHSKVDDPAILAKVQDIGSTIDSQERNQKIRDLNADLIVDFWYVPGVAWQLGWAASGARLHHPAAFQSNGRGGEGVAGYPSWWLTEA